MGEKNGDNTMDMKPEPEEDDGGLEIWDDSNVWAVARETRSAAESGEYLMRSELEAYLDSQEVGVRSLMKDVLTTELRGLRERMDELATKMVECQNKVAQAVEKVNAAQVLEIRGLDHTICEIRRDARDAKDMLQRIRMDAGLYLKS